MLRSWTRRLCVAAFLLATAGLATTQLAAAQPFTAPDAEEAFTRAFERYTDQLYDEAARAFADFRATYPDHVNVAEAYYYEASSMLALGHNEQAIRLFKLFQQRYPAHPLGYEARLTLGTYYYQTRQYDLALRTLEQVMADEPPPEIAAKALYWMGEAAMNQNRPDQALAYYRRAAEDYRSASTADAAQYAVAFTLVRLERFEEAARAFEVLAARYPDSRYARNIGLGLAEIYYELGDYPRTIDEVTRRMPSLTADARERAEFLLAESYNQVRNSEQAIVYYRRFTEANPESPYYRRALYGLAWNYHFQDAYQWAADHFAQVSAGHDDDLAAQATYQEGVNLVLAEQPREAMARFEEAIERWPDAELTDHARYELGLLLYDLRRWAEAEATFASVAELHPTSDLLGEALRMRGYSAVAQGDFDAALTSFDRAVSLDAAPAALKNDVLFQTAWVQYRNEQYTASKASFLDLLERADDRKRQAQALFWAAESAYQLDQLGEAQPLFRRYLNEYPGGDQTDAAHYALGWTHFRQGQYADAAQAFQAFLQAYRDTGGFVPYRTDALLRLADSYYALRRYPEAIQAYAQVAQEGNDYAVYQMAQALSNANDTFEAIQTLRQLLEDYPESTYREEARYSLGYLFFLNQDYDQAISEYEALIQTYPRDPLAPKAQYGIGDALFNAGRLEEAVEAYRIVLDRYPNSPFAADAGSSIQYALIAMDDEQRAADILDRFIEDNPDSPIVSDLRFRQAEAQYQTGQMEAALEAFQQFVRTSTNPQLLPEAYYYLGTIYSEQNRDTEAETYLRQLVETYPESPRSPDAARRLGQLYLDLGRDEAALRLYRRMEALRPDDARLVAQARYGRGQALLNLGRAEEAEALLQDVVQDAPNAPETLPALLGLARVAERRGDAAAAIQRYRTIVDRSQDEVGAEALYRLGSLLYQRGNPQGAIEELNRLTVLFPGYSDWIARGYLLQADAYQSIGQKGEAARLYDLLLRDYRGTPYAETAERAKAAL